MKIHETVNKSVTQVKHNRLVNRANQLEIVTERLYREKEELKEKLARKDAECNRLWQVLNQLATKHWLEDKSETETQ